MNVKLISHSVANQEAVAENIGDVQELVAFCARVSNPSNQNNSSTSEKLVRYLVKHAHWSPLEMVSACMEINTTRDIARQILRHRSFAFQEFSQRYADPTTDLQFELREARLQDHKNRQNSIAVEDPQLQSEWERHQQNVINMSKMAYQWAMEKGIAKEQARAVLPEGNTMSRIYVNGTLRSWVHYVELRSANGTQREHMEIAHACAVELAKIFPMITEFDGYEG